MNSVLSISSLARQVLEAPGWAAAALTALGIGALAADLAWRRRHGERD